MVQSDPVCGIYKTKQIITPEEHREKRELKPDYPMVAPIYAKQRSEPAKVTGLDIYLLHGVMVRRCEAPDLFHREKFWRAEWDPNFNFEKFSRVCSEGWRDGPFFSSPPSADEERAVKFL